MLPAQRMGCLESLGGFLSLTCQHDDQTYVMQNHSEQFSSILQGYICAMLWSDFTV